MPHRGTTRLDIYQTNVYVLVLMGRGVGGESKGVGIGTLGMKGVIDLI